MLAACRCNPNLSTCALRRTNILTGAQKTQHLDSLFPCCILIVAHNTPTPSTNTNTRRSPYSQSQNENAPNKNDGTYLCVSSFGPYLGSRRTAQWALRAVMPLRCPACLCGLAGCVRRLHAGRLLPGGSPDNCYIFQISLSSWRTPHQPRNLGLSSSRLAPGLTLTVC